MIPLDCFEGQSATGDFVPIVPGGRSIPLTYGNRPEYVSRALDFRLHEMDAQVRQDLRGNVIRMSMQVLGCFHKYIIRP